MCFNFIPRVLLQLAEALDELSFWEPSSFFSNRQSKTTTFLCHRRLGHCSHATVDLLKNQGLIEATSKKLDTTLCNGC